MKGMPTQAISHASELWEAIIEGAGLDVDRYDEQLVTELAESFGIPVAGFARELDRVGITVEVLLDRFLHLIAPYAAMMQEILAFFARAGAYSSSENLRIRIDFDALGDKFEFDLRNFRDWETQFRETVRRVELDLLDELRALQLRHAFVAEGFTYRIVGSMWLDIPPSDTAIVQWLSETTTEPARLMAFPPPPNVAEPLLSRLLERVWAFLRAAAWAAADDREASLSADDIRTIVRGAYLLRGEQPLLLGRLAEIFRDIPTQNVETVVLVEELMEIFNLPVWKRRSELYSIWVGVRLITAMGERVRVHVVDRSIVFSFEGTHLATLSAPSGEGVHVWCELRTRAAKLLGKGRRRAIQPDYVVLREPTSHPGSAIFVVECKQYLQQSRRVFAEALIDYARTHAQARVVLVNYGPTTTSVLEEVANADRSLLLRTQVIGRLRPGSASAIRQFEELVWSIVSKSGPPVDTIHEVHVVPAPTDKPPVDSDIDISEGSAYLTWQTAADLDLHCWMVDSEGSREHVYYAHLIADRGDSRVELNQDVQTGGEIEVVAWKKAGGVHLDLAVHAYSPEADIAKAEPRVKVVVRNCTWTFQPPRERQGKWWRLFRVEGPGSEIQIWNSLHDQEPSVDSL